MGPVSNPIFRALIVPHRSLSRRGVATVIGIVTTISLVVALRTWFMGAWPITIFAIIEIPLLAVLLAINFRHAKASELVMLDTEKLTLIRTDPAGRRRVQSMPSAWLRVDLDDSKGIPRIMVGSRGRFIEVGSFLHEPDKLSLFEALKDALYELRNPQFDNPQLR